MIQLTSRAAQKILSMQEELGDPSRKMRIFVEPGGCSGFEYGMSFDLPKPGDEACEIEGVGLLIDQDSLPYLRECRVDFDDGLHGKGFSIDNPNAQSTCGCGKSFN